MPDRSGMYWILIITLLLACQNKQGPSLVIATSANMQFAMEQLAETFAMETGIRCDLVVSSSGKLTAQILEGAPYDLLVAADMKYPNEILRHGLALDTPRVYAYGKLVLWTMREDWQPSLKGLADEQIRHIALAQTQTAPYGQAALTVLQNLPNYNSLKDKLVYGESIAQANQFILSRSADAGFTALSVVLSEKMKNNGQFLVLDTGLYAPIEQGVIAIRQKKTAPEQALRFSRFLFSDKARLILKDFGYSVDE